MAQIRITPEELESAATFLGEKLNAINEEVTALKGKIDETASNWEGAAQNSFIETFTNDMYPILNQTMPEVVNGIIAQLNSAADTLRTADEEIAKAFKG